MYAVVIIRHNRELGLMNNDSAKDIDYDKVDIIKRLIKSEVQEIHSNAEGLDKHLKERKVGVTSTIDGIISEEEINDIDFKLNELLEKWIAFIDNVPQPVDFNYRIQEERLRSLFTSMSDDNYSKHWKVSYSLREIGASAVIKTVQQ